jgi:hypothetical protein
MDGMTEAPRNPEELGPGQGTVVVVGPDGRPVGTVDTDAQADGEDPSRLIEQPAKVMRIGSMIKQLLEEVKAAQLDEASRARLKEIHYSSVKELEEGLAPELVEELDRLSLPFTNDSVPTEAELRIAQAQLVGWLEGLFHGIQTALAAQHAAREHAAQRQLRELPPGTVIAPGVIIGENGEPQRAGAPRSGAGRTPLPESADPDHGPGQYL